jgi:hypothetical protein
VKGLVGRRQGRAMVSGAAPAIQRDEFLARQRFNPPSQFLQPLRLGSWAKVFCTRNMCLRVERIKAHVDCHRSLGRRRLGELRQVLWTDLHVGGQ